MTKKLILIAILCIGTKNLMAQLFTALDPKKTHVEFVNYLKESEEFNVMNYEYLYNGGGVAIGDINNDGLQDLFFSGNLVANKLYLNKGGLEFDDISLTAKIDQGNGFNTGVTMMDINGDGWLDIYVSKSALKNPKMRVHNLYINNHDNTFTDRAKEFGLADSSYSTQAYFYDFDIDGDLDLFLLNHPEKIKESKKVVLTYNKKGVLEVNKNNEERYVSCRFYENVKGHFYDKTRKAGLITYAFGLSAIVADFNQDRFPDIYVANDYTQPDYLYINNKNGTFSEKSDSFFTHYSYSSMGSDYADLDNDGDNDLMVLDMLSDNNYRQKQFKTQMSYDQFDKLVKYGLKAQQVKNVLYRNQNNKSYVDVSYATGMANTDWSWAPLFADFDNDGLKDVYITNGYVRDFTDQDINRYMMDSLIKVYRHMNGEHITNVYPMVNIPNFFYKNLGQFKFQKLGPESGADIPSLSNGAAYGDLDNDGDLDLVVNNINQYAFVYRNNSVENKYGQFLRFKIKSNAADNGYGAKIQIYTPDSGYQEITYYPTKGYLSCHEHRVHFGLGKNNEANVHVTWPNGQEQWLSKVAANQELVLDQQQAANPSTSIAPSKDLYFEDITSKLSIDYKQNENEYIDFKLEPLLYRKFSKQGPSVAVGDANGDGLDDFFVGGAKEEVAQLFIQKANGTFGVSVSEVWREDKMYEDLASRWIDIDKDGDLDLLVASGGNDYPNLMSQYPFRCYINDGKGQFSRPKAGFFPTINVSAKSFAIEDFDKNGWPDVFVAGQLVPGHYGLFPNSYVLRNFGDHFTVDSIKMLGMINDVVWHDIDRDGWQDILMVGEWTPIQFLKNKSGILDTTIQSIGDIRGLFQKIHLADFDQDGQKEIVAGNMGINTRYFGSTNRPLYMFVNDFDKNGSTDAVIAYFNKDTLYPMPNRDLMLDQMIFLKKRFTRYAPYSRATMKDVFTESERKDTKTFIANNLNTVVVYLDAPNNIAVKKLANDAQYFPVKAINTLDVDRDGDLDLLLSGNEYGMEIESGMLDAGIGLVMRNDGNKKWTPIYDTGYLTMGDVTDVQPIRIQEKNGFLVAKNKGNLQVLLQK